jgi:hypothetical protein
MGQHLPSRIQEQTNTLCVGDVGRERTLCFIIIKI